MWRGLGSPNTLRHTLHTYLQTVGVPQAQIDAAAGHSSERGSGRNYTHLRPEYLKDFIDAVEAYWREMDRLTKVHRVRPVPSSEEHTSELQSIMRDSHAVFRLKKTHTLETY